MHGEKPLVWLLRVRYSSHYHSATMRDLSGSAGLVLDSCSHLPGAAALPPWANRYGVSFEGSAGAPAGRADALETVGAAGVRGVFAIECQENCSVFDPFGNGIRHRFSYAHRTTYGDNAEDR